jgi:hypothetical protein
MSVEHTKNLYTISTIKQLIDINKNTVNFKCNFAIVSTDSKPFQAIVVTQSILDTSDKLDFEQVTDGNFSGEILVNQNIYDNYFIVMKAAEPTSVEVVIDFEALPDYIPQGKGVELEKSSWTPANKKHIMMFIGTIILLAIIWYYYSRQETSNKPSSSPLAPIIELAPRESLLENLKKLPIE